jgi:hypothetical protein
MLEDNDFLLTPLTGSFVSTSALTTSRHISSFTNSGRGVRGHGLVLVTITARLAATLLGMVPRLLGLLDDLLESEALLVGSLRLHRTHRFLDVSDPLICHFIYNAEISLIGPRK